MDAPQLLEKPHGWYIEYGRSNQAPNSIHRPLKIITLINHKKISKKITFGFTKIKKTFKKLWICKKILINFILHTNCVFDLA